MSTSKPKESGAAGSSDSLFALNDGDVDSAKKRTPDEPAAPASDAAPASSAPQNGDLVRGSLHQGSATNHALRLGADEAFGAATPASDGAPGDADPASSTPLTSEGPAPTQLASLEQSSDADAGARASSVTESAPQGSGSQASGSSAAETRTALAAQTTEAPNSGTPAGTAGAAQLGAAADDEAADETAASPTLAIAPATGDEDSAIPLDIRAALGDSDGSETLSIKVSGVPAGAILSAGIDNGDGSWTLTPAQLEGLTITPPPNSDDDFVLTVTATSTEANGADTASVSVELPVTVNAVADAPNVAVGPSAGAEDTAIPLDISASLNDLDGSESLSIVFSNVPNGAVLSAGTLNVDGTWTLTPAQLQGLTITPPPNSDGDFTISVTATTTEGENGDSFALTAQITVGVAAVADIPTLSVAPAVGAEDTAIPLDIASALTDFDGSESLSITISGMPAGALLSAGTANADGSWTLTASQLQGLAITPPANSDSDFTLTVTATSSEGENGDTATVTAQIPVTIAAVADAPTLVVSQASGAEDSALPLDITSALTDVDGSESLSITISGMPSGAVLSAGTANADGTWTLTPAQLQGLTITPPANSGGDFTLTVTATSTESENGDTAITTVQIPVNVTAVADAPTLVVSPATGAEDTAIALDISSALTDVDGSETLSINISGMPAGAVLSAGAQNTDGSWTLTQAQLQGLTITPPANSGGDFTLTVTATSTESENGDASNVTAQIPVTVTAAADAPTLVVGSAVGAEDAAIPLDISSALTDLDGSETLSITISGMPAGAVLSAGAANADGSWTLTPAQLQGLTVTPPANSGADFTLTVTATSTESENGDASSVTAQIPVTVTAAADAPTLVVGSAVGAEDAAIPLDISSALTDVDGSETLSITISGMPAGAVLSAGTANADGSWTLTPAQLQGLTLTPPANSDADFTLTVTATSTESENGDASTVTAQIPVTVTAAADAPTLVVGSAVGAEDAAIPLDITSALTDLDGSETLSITVSGTPAGAVLSAGTANADGSWTLTPAQLQGLTLTPPANSDADFTLTVTATSTESENGDASSVSVMLPVSVAAVADAPILALGNVEFAPGSTVDFPINATLADIDGSESMSVTISGLPAGAILSAGQMQPDGSWTLSQGELAGLKLTLPPGFRGEYSIDVTATSTESSNGDAETVTSQFKLTVDRDLQIVISHAVLPDGSQDTTDSYVMGEGTSTTVAVTGSEMQIAGVASSAGVSTTYDAAGNVDIGVTSAWGSVRNVRIDDDQPRNITIRNFVDADVALGDGGPSIVSVIDAKGGNIVTGDGADTVTVVARSDSTGGPLSNKLEISTGAGDDIIRVTAASNGLTLPTIDAGDGADTIEILGTSADLVFGGAGDDRILTNGGNDIIDGGSGNNYIDAGAGNNQVTAGTGNDTIYTGAGSDTIDAGGGNDIISGGAGTDTAIYSSAAAGVSINLGITTAQDTGGAGTDTLSGIENLVGSAFDDTLTGDGNVNVLTGGAGRDILDGGAGNDSLVGDTGDDVLVGGAGNDRIDGGADVDTASYATATAAVTVNLAVAAAQNTGGAGTDTLVSIENLTGSNFNDVLTGNTADNQIAGGIGNDTIDGGAGNDTLAGGAGNDTLVGGLGDDTLDGGADIDTASYAAATAAVTVSLATTATQNTGGAGNDRLTGIENLTGSAFNDVLTGDGASNVLTGGSGNDILDGGAGDDRLDGGAGTDTASYGTAGAGVTVSLALTTAQNTVGAGIDTLAAIENLTGSNFNDVLTGNTGANVITGGAGDDTIEGGAGNDTLTGGTGIDTASYASATAAVTVNLATVAAQNTGGAGTDTLSQFENLVGSRFNDILTGDGNANRIIGGAGNDTIDGGAGNDVLSGDIGNDTLTGGSGDDLIDGGAGTDTASYAAATSAVTVNLAVTAAQNTGGAGIDTLTAIENLTGSGFNDVLTGDANANVLSGGAGADVLDGGAGNDSLLGGAGNDTMNGGLGNDTLDGGTGIDTASYATATAGVTVTLSTTAAQNTGGAGTDRLTAIENLTGSSFDDTLTGNGSANVLAGGAGSDILDGGAGNDTVSGGAGNDTLTGGAGNDTIDGGADVDTASYATATSAVTVNLATTTAQNTGGGGTDTLTSIENVTGSNLNDTLTGNAGGNLLSGGAGNDTLRGAAGDDTLVGGTGNDTLDGGAGIDTASYSTAGSGVTVNLAVTTAQNTGGAGTDTLTAIENLTGSGFGDTLTGDGNANIIIGGAGNDTLNGGAGNDWLSGGLGNDTAIGGAGSDIYLFEQGGGQDSFNGGAGWTDQISLSGVTGGPGSGGWTITLTQGSVTSSGSNQLDLSADAAGTIQFADGSVLDFSGVETVTW